MCILFYKSSTDADVITEEMLRDMWSSNPHGAGFAFRKTIDKGNWAVTKGFMTLTDMLDFWETIHDCEEIVGHLRYATHGEKTRYNCHPFALAATLEESTSLNPVDGLAELFFHNGVLHEFGSHNVSDSADFCVRVLSRMDHISRLMIMESVEGKFAYIDTDGKVHLVGDFSEYMKGLTVSNKYWDKSKMFPASQKHFGVHQGGTYQGGTTTAPAVGFRDTPHIDHSGRRGHQPYAGSEADDCLADDWNRRFDDPCRHGKFTAETEAEIKEEFDTESQMTHERYDELCYKFDEINEMREMLDEIEDADEIRVLDSKIAKLEAEIQELDPYIDPEKSEYMKEQADIEAEDTELEFEEEAIEASEEEGSVNQDANQLELPLTEEGRKELEAQADEILKTGQAPENGEGAASGETELESEGKGVVYNLPLSPRMETLLTLVNGSKVKESEQN